MKDQAVTFRGVTVTPYSDLLDSTRGGLYHRGGPRWPEWSRQTVARHHTAGKPRDTEPEAVEPQASLAGRWAWCGPVVRHYGHQIADFSTRLFVTLEAWPDARILTTVKPASRIHDLTDAPAFYREILAWVGVSPANARLETVAVAVDELFVLPQQEQFRGPGPSEAYLDLLDRETRRRLGPASRAGSLYVSRAGMRARFAGEAYIEAALAEAGVPCLRPETIPLRDQLSAYRSAATLLFAESSAIHSAQLMGRALGDVVVLDRRSGWRIAEHSIAPRSRSLRYVDATLGLVHGLDLGGRPAVYFGLSVLDERRLLESLAALGVGLGSTWDSRAFRAAELADARAWLEAERKTPRPRIPGSAEHIHRTLQEAGLAEAALGLMPPVGP